MGIAAPRPVSLHVLGIYQVYKLIKNRTRSPIARATQLVTGAGMNVLFQLTL